MSIKKRSKTPLYITKNKLNKLCELLMINVVSFVKDLLLLLKIGVFSLGEVRGYTTI